MRESQRAFDASTQGRAFKKRMAAVDTDKPGGEAAFFRIRNAYWRALDAFKRRGSRRRARHATMR